MKNTKPQASRKAAAPALSAEEELAELLADPTLQPSITFLGLRESPSLPARDTESVPDTETVPPTESELRTRRRILFNSRDTDTVHTPPVLSGSGAAPVSIPATVPVPGIERVSPSESRPPTRSIPDPESASGLLKSSSARYQRPKSKRAATVEEGHSHIEHHVYETLWSAAAAQPDGTRILTVGFGTMSHMVRLSLNNCRLNVRSLIRKLAMEEHRGELCPQGVGKTYLLYSPEAILRRRKEAGLDWVIRTRGVVFVDPTTGQPIEQPS